MTAGALRTSRATLAIACSTALLAAASLFGASLAAAGSDHAAAPSCPSRSSPAPVNRNEAARSVLVPGGAVAVRLCRYNGLSRRRGHGLGLAAQALIASATRTRRLAASFDRLEAMPDRPISCPMDRGRRLFALFAYRGLPADVVTVNLSGCVSASNGALERGFWLSDSLERQLLRVTAS